SNGHIRLNWDVLNLKGRSNTFDVNYRLQYRPNENKFNIRATVRGFDNKPFGHGSCKIAPGESLGG
ncbi:MAG: hypothetical protein AAF252_16440, partial [Pseudomonadota bacterium]